MLLYDTTVRGARAAQLYVELSSQLVSIERAAAASGNGGATFFHRKLARGADNHDYIGKV